MIAPEPLALAKVVLPSLEGVQLFIWPLSLSDAKKCQGSGRLVFINGIIIGKENRWRHC